MPGMEKKKYKARRIWKTNEEIFLLELWKERAGDLRRAKRNMHIFSEMEQEFAKNNIYISDNEIKTKIDNLTKKYRSEKQKSGTTGGTPSTWVYFQDVHEIIGTYPMSKVDKLIHESLGEDSGASTSTLVSATDDNESEVINSDELELQEGEYIIQTLDETNDLSASQVSVVEVSESAESSQPPNKKRKTHQESIIKILEDTNSNIKKYADRQIEKESERNEILKNYLEKKNEIYKSTEEEKIRIAQEKNEWLKKIFEKDP
uniref:CSON003517 protein n=1 Tax=Culicoides sonorensis TaxID=179676 RepID=A0A336L1I4_CULSO